MAKPNKKMRRNAFIFGLSQRATEYCADKMDAMLFGGEARDIVRAAIAQAFVDGATAALENEDGKYH